MNEQQAYLLAILDGLKEELLLAGLPVEAKHILGRAYEFTYPHPLNPQVLIGVVNGICMSPHLGLCLIVSNAKVWGINSNTIVRGKSDWFVPADSIESGLIRDSLMSEMDLREVRGTKKFKGTFRLLTQ